MPDGAEFQSGKHIRTLLRNRLAVRSSERARSASFESQSLAYNGQTAPRAAQSSGGNRWRK